jgi:hypothetical protein
MLTILHASEEASLQPVLPWPLWPHRKRLRELVAAETSLRSISSNARRFHVLSAMRSPEERHALGEVAGKSRLSARACHNHSSWLVMW